LLDAVGRQCGGKREKADFHSSPSFRPVSKGEIG
jgi:hypothetical protein